ncbi:hypothetical protein ABK040_000945 [Willaertia magna]
MNTSYIAQVEESIVVAVTQPVELVEEEVNALKRKRETKEENEEEKEEACEEEPTLETTDNNVDLTQGSSTSLDEENEVPTFFYEDPERAVSFYKIVLGLEIQPNIEEKGEDV